MSAAASSPGIRRAARSSKGRRSSPRGRYRFLLSFFAWRFSFKLRDAVFFVLRPPLSLFAMGVSSRAVCCDVLAIVSHGRAAVSRGAEARRVGA